ncbi:hypothetical protein TNCV_2314531 [Trichonephila clavipes]|nr:hypothetical protein TNCV_2314531 [Trichonephila clavipes]
MTSKEKEARVAFKDVVIKFLGNYILDYKRILMNMRKKFQELGCSVLTNGLLYTCINLVSMYTKYLTDRAQRNAFLETRRAIETRHKTAKENNKQFPTKDNPGPCTARVSVDCFRAVKTIIFAACSPDLSPIEHFWDINSRVPYLGNPKRRRFKKTTSKCLAG